MVLSITFLCIMTIILITFYEKVLSHEGIVVRKEDSIMSNEGILVVGHGSKLDFNRETIEYVAESLRGKNGFTMVRAGFMGYNSPTIPEALEMLVEDGAETIYVAPCFLAAGMHTTHDIRRKLDIEEGAWEKRANVNGKDVVLKYCEPIGKDPRITDIMVERIDAAKKG